VRFLAKCLPTQVYLDLGWSTLFARRAFLFARRAFFLDCKNLFLKRAHDLLTYILAWLIVYRVMESHHALVVDLSLLTVPVLAKTQFWPVIGLQPAGRRRLVAFLRRYSR
jgi:hypothetical protein